MKIGKVLLKIGNKISNKKEDDDVKDKEILSSKTADEKDDWQCWWLFNKPRKPRCFK